MPVTAAITMTHPAADVIAKALRYPFFIGFPFVETTRLPDFTRWRSLPPTVSYA
jgi:hypothetical protein